MNIHHLQSSNTKLLLAPLSPRCWMLSSVGARCRAGRGGSPAGLGVVRHRCCHAMHVGVLSQTAACNQPRASSTTHTHQWLPCCTYASLRNLPSDRRQPALRHVGLSSSQQHPAGNMPQLAPLLHNKQSHCSHMSSAPLLAQQHLQRAQRGCAGVKQAALRAFGWLGTDPSMACIMLPPDL